MSLIHFRPMLSRTTALSGLAHNTLVAANAHASLPMPGQGIMSGEHIAAETFIWFVTGVYLGVALKVVSADEAFIAVITLVLTISKVCLDMGLDVLFPSEPAFATGV